MADYLFENHGSVWLCRPTSVETFQYLHEHVGNNTLWIAGGLAVEPRYVETLAASLEDAGFSTEV